MNNLEIFWNDVEEAPSSYNNIINYDITEGCLCILDSFNKGTIIPLVNIKMVESYKVQE